MLRKKKNNVFIGDADRRALPRLPPEAFASLKGEFLGSGTSVKFINISSGGALVESEERLAPSAKIYLRITSTEGTLLLRGRILRSVSEHPKAATTERLKTGHNR